MTVWWDTRTDTARGFIGKGAWAESSRVRNLGEVLCCMAHRPGFRGAGIRFHVVSSQYSDSGSLLVACASLSQDAFQWGWFWEVCRTYVLASSFSFWPFLNPGWWWLVSFTFLSRTACCKITQVSGYYQAWPGWTVLVNGFPNNISLRDFILKILLGNWGGGLLLLSLPPAESGHRLPSGVEVSLHLI